MRQPGEPSVDEILESIKQVMAQDDRARAERLRTDGEAGTAQDEVLDLADMDDAAQLRDEPAGDGPAGDGPAGDGPAGDGPAGGEPDGNAPAALVADSTASSMRETFGSLASLTAPDARAPSPPVGDTSLEAMVREMLRPALAEWLDRNLPPIVERLVAAEIARITRQRG